MSQRRGQVLPEIGQSAFADTDFLMRDEMRGHRLALEYERAELGLKDQRIRSTVVIRGQQDPPSLLS